MKKLIAITLIATMVTANVASASSASKWFKKVGKQIERQNVKTNKAFVKAFGKDMLHGLEKLTYVMGAGATCAGNNEESHACDVWKLGFSPVLKDRDGKVIKFYGST